MHALGQRVLRKSHNVAAALSEVGNLFTSEKVRVRRRDHAKSAQKFHERIANFPEFWRATRTEFVNLGQHALRKSYDVTEALGRVHGASRSEKAGARRRDHANFVRKSRERIAILNFRNVGAPCAKRIAYTSTRPAFAAKNIVTSLQLLVKLEVCSDPKKCAPGVEITQNLRKNFAKELQNFRNFGMPLAEKMRALGQRALHNSRNVAETLSEVGRLI